MPAGAEIGAGRPGRYNVQGDIWTLPLQYKLKDLVGKGAYGSVCQAVDVNSGKEVAIKRIANVFVSKTDALRILREISILRRLNHPNIISLVEVPEIDPPPAPVRTLYVVFDFAGCDLHKLAQNNTVIPLETVKTLMKQMCMATRYLHHCCVIHRDLKPANILIDPKTWRLRIADFGLSRVLDQGQHSAVEDVKVVEQEINPGVGESSDNDMDDPSDFPSPPKMTRQISEHVVTRWYRAPEVILCRGHYGYSIDVWSVGCIFAELLNMCVDQPTTKKRPLFPGRSCFPLSPSSHTCFKDVTDQLNVIFSIIGTPSQDEIDALEAGDDVKTYLARLNPAPAADLSQKFPHADKQALTILSGMLTFLASERLTFDQALDNPFLASAETPDDVQDETSVNFAPVGLVRKSSNLAAQDLLAMDLEHQYDRRNHEEAVKRLSVMFRKEIDDLHVQQRSDADAIDGEMFHDCPEASSEEVFAAA